jgi:BirA family transcriptional regulator, biotin operon repressor / biotin---[acetyl-CoA-carboxylase] ligase
MKTPDRVIELLYDRPQWWSMAELARTAGVGAARLDQALAELRGRGHQMDFSPTAGIRLRHPPGLDAHLIERGLGVRRVGRHVICFGVLDSTNDTAFDSARQAGSDGVAVLAEAQSKGRGRHGRRWLSPPGANVLMSVLLIDPKAGLPTEAVTILAGLAVAEGIEAALPGRRLACRLKWPNDVLLEDRKISGVLVEQRIGPKGRVLVIGIGVNVNAHPGRSDVTHRATSLAEQAGEELDRIPIAREVLRRLDKWVCDLADAPETAMADLREGWTARCGMIDRRYTIISRGRPHAGRVLGIDPLEGLILLTDEGTHLRIPARGATVG